MQLRIDGYRQRRAWTVWHAAALTRMTELPPIEDLIANAQRDPDPEILGHRMRQWQAAMDRTEQA